MKTAVAIRHLAFEDLGLLEPYLHKKGYRTYYYDAGVDELWRLDLRDVDLLIILGGPIGAEEEESYSFLTEEIRIIRDRVDSQAPLLGICLGAQLIAKALSASVRPMLSKEIGFSPVELTDAGQFSILHPLAGQPVLHWHGDMFELPVGTPSLARTSSCPNQAFMVGSHVLALQFHLEVDLSKFERWLIGHAFELSQACIDIQSLRKEALAQQKTLPSAFEAVMDAWLEKAQR